VRANVGYCSGGWWCRFVYMYKLDHAFFRRRLSTNTNTIYIYLSIYQYQYIYIYSLPPHSKKILLPTLHSRINKMRKATTHTSQSIP